MNHRQAQTRELLTVTRDRVLPFCQPGVTISERLMIWRASSVRPAVMQLVLMRGMGLLTDDDLRRFSESTQEVIRGVDAMRNAKPNRMH